MPKLKNKQKIEARIIIKKVATKFKIGTRKSHVSGHSMSTIALRELLSNSSKSRYHSKAIAVLKCRGESLMSQ